MDYQQIIDEVMNLDFITDQDQADACTKAVWGVIASAVDEQTANEIARDLPGPLTVGKLRSHQVRPTRLSADEFVQEIAGQFRLNTDQSRQLIRTAIGAGEKAMPEQTLSDLKQAIPADLQTVL